MPLIEVEHLSKRFLVAVPQPGISGAVRSLFRREQVPIQAVDDISFTIARGELVGYLGPNGAGKSTTIKMLTGILVPTSGTLRVGGLVPWRQRVAHVARIGVVFGQRTNLWWDLPVMESLDLLRHIYRVQPARFRANLETFRALLDLDPFLGTPVRSLSLGQRMRADLAAALLHDPEVVFLDEPTIGLDVVAKDRIRRFLRQVNEERGVTFILTTHDLGDVEKLCRRVLMIDHGRLLFDGPLAELQARFGGERALVVDFAEDYEDVSVAGATLVEREGRRATYRFGRDGVSASALIERLARAYRIADLTVREPEVEGTVRRIYEERLLLAPADD
jgi:ABC-2 type transport system ATP-binding protein